MNPITRKSMSKSQPSFRAVGQKAAEWQTFKKIRDKCMVVGPPKPDYHTCLLFLGFSNVCHFTCIWPRALKLGCITSVDMLFLTNGFSCLFYENKLYNFNKFVIFYADGHIKHTKFDATTSASLYPSPRGFLSPQREYWATDKEAVRENLWLPTIRISLSYYDRCQST